jgi:endonuclease G, mitochondrial
MRTKKTFRTLFVVFALAVTCTLSAGAQDSECLRQLHASTLPTLINQGLGAKIRRLCFSEFVLLHSGVTRTPIWSAERLTKDRIEAASQLDRPSSSAFHAEKRLPKSERSELSDYQQSGFDRGHMSPNGDMSTEDAQEESFSLANMIPQHPCHNEVMWEGIESAVRDLALSEGEVFVVTGPAFVGDNVETLDERVMIPTHVFKAVFIPSRNAAAAYWTPNDGSQTQEHVSIARLKELIGIDVFPQVDSNMKQTAMPLPDGTPHHKCRLRTSNN